MELRTADDGGGLAWADVEACTLPTAERPLRVAAFDGLFTTSVTSVDRRGDVVARLELRGGADLADRTERLVEAESACCSFFRFTVAQEEPGRVTLEVEVPPAYVDVLAALVARAQAARSNAS
jgi:hypothetical protein